MLRLAKLGDLPTIMGITKLAVDYMNNIDNVDQWDDTYPNKEVFIEDITSKTLYIFEFKNEIVGYICINNQIYDSYNQVSSWHDTFENATTFHRVCINPKNQNKGLGKQLLQEAESLVYEAGNDYIIIDTYSLNLRMNNLLLNLNYNFLGQMHLKPGKEKWNCYDKKIKHS